MFELSVALSGHVLIEKRRSLVMSSMRIVLVDPLGDVLFSGESCLGRGAESPVASCDVNEPEPEPEADVDVYSDCPQTLRSGGSGIFPVGKPGERAA